MECFIEREGTTFRMEPAGVDIAIPLDFQGPQPSSFGAPPARAQVYRDGDFVGEVKGGGSCRVMAHELIPHCNGTHTECAGHLTAEPLFLPTQLQQSLLLARLISVTPLLAANCQDAYDPAPDPADRLISRASLEQAFGAAKLPVDALVVRTLPNDGSKRSRDYAASGFPFFSLDAMQWVRARGVQHLLVDTPSVDRMRDEGKLGAHRVFWDMPPGSTQPPLGPAARRTITEMVFVPDALPDGLYVLNLQVPAFLSDAAPSRPQLHRLQVR